MGHKATYRWEVLLVLVGVCVAPARAQTALEWRRIGNSAIEMALPSVATGPVDRVWYSADASTLYVRTASGRVFQTSDFEQWRIGSAAAPVREPNREGSAFPESGLKQVLRGSGGRVYAVGRNAYRSDDGGVSWANLTDYKGTSILGAELEDLAVSSNDV